jgi:phage N-6-adenine-methyltransferase
MLAPAKPPGRQVAIRTGRSVVTKVDRDAEAIGKLWRSACHSLVESQRYYVECGRKLIDKRDKLDHGEWLPWLKSNREVLGFAPRTVQVLMKAASNTQLAAHLNDPVAALALNRELWGHKLRGTQGTGFVEWYTPADIVAAVREVLGTIDLDPASSEIAQRTVNATNYYIKDDDGLTKEWRGRVWLNPPYSQPAIEHFADKMIAEYSAGNVATAIMLTHNYTETAWFQKLIAAAVVICLPGQRIRFADPDGGLADPTQGQALFFFGPDPARFKQVFRPFGEIVKLDED